MVQRDLVAVATNEQADPATGVGGIRSGSHLDAIYDQAQGVANRADRQLVGRIARLDSVGLLPGLQIDPVVRLASPDADLTFVADLQNVVTTSLTDAILGGSALVADDDAVATTRGSAKLVQRGAHDDVRRNVSHRRADRDELTGPARGDLVDAVAQPGRALGIVRPGGSGGSKPLVEERGGAGGRLRLSRGLADGSNGRASRPGRANLRRRLRRLSRFCRQPRRRNLCHGRPGSNGAGIR